MKEIRYCPTELDWIKASGELEFPVSVLESRVVIDYDGSIYKELDDIPIIARLKDRKQLGLLGRCGEFLQSSHTRYKHSLVMATKADYTAQVHGLERDLLVSSCMFHDAASPPFSDSVSKPLGLNDQEYFVPS
jgi:HD superfamily phosphohydrolase